MKRLLCVLTIAFVISPLFADPVRNFTLLGRDLQLDSFPEDELFHPLISDIRYPRAGLDATYVLQNIIDTGQSADSGEKWRNGVKVGGSQGFLRLSPRGLPDVGVEMELGLFIKAVFDQFGEQDNFGWDGIAHAVIAGRLNNGLAFRWGYHHLSSHAGDEYLERYRDTGEGFPGTVHVKIDDYVRDSVILGIEYTPMSWLSMMAEGLYSLSGRPGWYSTNSESPWQFNFGAEMILPEELTPRFAPGQPFLSGMVLLPQDADWSPSFSIQTGFLLSQDNRGGRRTWFAVEYYAGRVPLNYFWSQEESYIILGFNQEF